MNKKGIRFRNALSIGTVCAVLEGLLVFFADPTASRWVLIQSMLFWFSCGCIVTLAETGLPKTIGSILLTELLNLPWFIALVVIPKQYSHLLPLIVASLIFGVIIGFLNKALKTPVPKFAE
ncbi:hypothetical protein [Leptospira alstonii]|uniref:Uncharacterized protein n=3 Tax=Leptospira alstonii TaxID=28452 RepID=M6D3D3_9LEPT|nr:hypothetical protein [Leptospira alstonii]EMJ95733.1 hypothetical protein LEP1GSC194_3087 [Leptospira alstonii serovar Sichuan str. 79601]EQA80688.1 hypothetical protein LEP1GSC193_3813 [Leptospira alstonii serovar Pingchang str. 80-412]